MKLNMIVVITRWLPRRACNNAGTKAQAAPKPAATTAAAAKTRGAGRSPTARTTNVAPRPPSAAWPSPPMLKSPAWNGNATASPADEGMHRRRACFETRPYGAPQHEVFTDGIKGCPHPEEAAHGSGLLPARG